MNATGYIIEPSWFYWLNVVDNFKVFLIVLAVILTIAIIWGFISMSCDKDLINKFPTMCENEKRSVAFWEKLLKVLIVAFIVDFIAIIFTPGKETLITMMVAKYATYENVGLTVDVLKGAVDYVIQSIQSLK